MGAFHGSHSFPCRSLLLRTTVLNDMYVSYEDNIRIMEQIQCNIMFARVSKMSSQWVY